MSQKEQIFTYFPSLLVLFIISTSESVNLIESFSSYYKSGVNNQQPLAACTLILMVIAGLGEHRPGTTPLCCGESWKAMVELLDLLDLMLTAQMAHSYPV